MSGVAVIRYLLAHNSALTALVEVTSIMAGDIPQGTAMPALSVQQISSLPRLTVSMHEAKTQHTVRVQVTAYVKDSASTPAGGDYPSLDAILAKVLAACPNTHGLVNSIDVDSILPDIEGPDLPDVEVGVLTRSRDFIVKYNA